MLETATNGIVTFSNNPCYPKCVLRVVGQVEELPYVTERRKAGRLVDLQTPGEWADNNHPLWSTDRSVWQGTGYTVSGMPTNKPGKKKTISNEF